MNETRKLGTTRGRIILFTILGLLTLLLFFIDIAIGSVSIPVHEVFSTLFNSTGITDTNWIIIHDYRLPKALTALLAGAALSVSGLQMQTVFRNPLAGPYVLGISAGASLGVALLILGMPWLKISLSNIFLSHISTVLAAFIGAGAFLFIILSVSARIKDVMTILILGILLGSGVSAIVNILQFFSNQSLLKSYVLWTMGDLSNVTIQQLNIMIPVVLFGLITSILSIKMLNAFLLGEEYAKTMGMNIMLARFILFVSTSLLAGTVTAFCGPIGFIGIAVPHLSRIIFGTAHHGVMVPGTILTGAIFLLTSDIISHLPGSEAVLPVNAITSLLGIPVIIWIIFRNLKFSSMV
ncbi:MAG: FecCD family ABC transporter permease [Bacteroidota bacterium]